MKDLIGYDKIIEASMRDVVRKTLKKIEKAGLPGGHYFVITFATKASGVEISQDLLKKYPEEMTIILQNQFRGLEVNEANFKVALSFSGKFEKLIIPYIAVSTFSDPSINFVLKFSAIFSQETNHEISEENNEEIDAQNFQQISSNQDNKGSAIDLKAKVISLDAFRKNRNPKKS